MLSASFATWYSLPPPKDSDCRPQIPSLVRVLRGPGFSVYKFLKKSYLWKLLKKSLHTSIINICSNFFILFHVFYRNMPWIITLYLLLDNYLVYVMDNFVFQQALRNFFFNQVSSEEIRMPLLWKFSGYYANKTSHTFRIILFQKFVCWYLSWFL